MRKTERWTSKKTFLYSIEKLRIKTMDILSKIHSENIENYNIAGKKYNIEFSRDKLGYVIPSLIIDDKKRFLVREFSKYPSTFNCKNYIPYLALFGLFFVFIPSLICWIFDSNDYFWLAFGTLGPSSLFAYFLLYLTGMDIAYLEEFCYLRFGFFNGSDWELIMDTESASKKELLQLETFLELVVKIDEDVKNNMNNLFFSKVNSVKQIETDKVGALTLKD